MGEQLKAKQREIAKSLNCSLRQSRIMIQEKASEKLAIFFMGVITQENLDNKKTVHKRINFNTGCHYTVSR